MGQAIGVSLPLAVGIALSPIPIIAVVLMLTSDRARVNGPAFVLGERSAKLLAGLKDWMSAHNAVIMTVLCLIIAAKFIGDGISGLA